MNRIDHLSTANRKPYEETLSGRIEQVLGNDSRRTGITPFAGE